MTHCRPRSEHRSERAQELRATMTSRGLAIRASRSFFTLRSATQGCRSPQGTSPLPATREARFSVTFPLIVQAEPCMAFTDGCSISI